MEIVIISILSILLLAALGCLFWCIKVSKNTLFIIKSLMYLVWNNRTHKSAGEKYQAIQQSFGNENIINDDDVPKKILERNIREINKW